MVHKHVWILGIYQPHTANLFFIFTILLCAGSNPLCPCPSYAASLSFVHMSLCQCRGRMGVSSHKLERVDCGRSGGGLPLPLFISFTTSSHHIRCGLQGVLICIRRRHYTLTTQRRMTWVKKTVLSSPSASLLDSLLLEFGTVKQKCKQFYIT